jgi:hypothetical protein
LDTGIADGFVEELLEGYSDGLNNRLSARFADGLWVGFKTDGLSEG